AAEFQLDGVELLAHRLRPLLLPGHDESAADVAILDEAFPVGHVQPLCHLQCRGAAGVGYRNHDIDVVVGPVAQDLIGQLFTHTQPRLVDGHAVDDGIRPRQVDVLEDTGRAHRVGSALAGMDVAVHVDVDRLTGVDIAYQLEAQHVQGHALGGDAVFPAVFGFALTQAGRSNAVRVAAAEEHGGIENGK